MTEADDYLYQVIDKHKAPNIHFRDSRLTDLKNDIRAWGHKWIDDIILFGSCAKKTALKGSSDCDLFISLLPETKENLQDIHTLLGKSLKQAGYRIRKQNVSFRVYTNGLEVDIVPGRLQGNNEEAHSLHVSRTKSWIKTNIFSHLDLVERRGRQDEIMALKIWRNCHGLKFPSIYIEIVVMGVLYGRRKNQIANNFDTILEYLRGNFIYEKVVDPANNNNIISELLNLKQKNAIRRKAVKCLQADSWDKVIW